MIPLSMVMDQVFFERPVERCFSEQNQPSQALLLDTPNPPLSEGIEIGASSGKGQRSNARVVQNGPKRGRELAIAVVDQISDSG